MHPNDLLLKSDAPKKQKRKEKTSLINRKILFVFLRSFAEKSLPSVKSCESCRRNWGQSFNPNPSLHGMKFSSVINWYNYSYFAICVDWSRWNPKSFGPWRAVRKVLRTRRLEENQTIFCFQFVAFSFMISV